MIGEPLVDLGEPPVGGVEPASRVARIAWTSS
jgi:hypothetical protein